MDNSFKKFKNYILFLGGRMLSIVKSMALHGLDGYLVDVQVDVSSRASVMGGSTDFQMLA